MFFYEFTLKYKICRCGNIFAWDLINTQRNNMHTLSLRPISNNKRAQRALGRSPEEMVKGHSGANNREPQGHNLNNLGRGHFDDVIY